MSRTLSSFRPGLVAACAILSAALLAGCPPKKSVKRGAPGAPGSGDIDTNSDLDGGLEARMRRAEDGLSASDLDGREADIRGPKEFVSIDDLEAVYFDYDMYRLSTAAKVALRNNAAYLKAHPGLQVLVEGHCDDRGTGGYNLALGQKRAKAVREYYMALGIPGKNLGTISFGEENPSCSEATEDCWRDNRRALSKVRTEVSSNGQHKKRPVP